MTNFRKAAVVAAISMTAMGLTSRMAMADGFQPYISVFGGGSALNNIHGGFGSSCGGPITITPTTTPGAKPVGACAIIPKAAPVGAPPVITQPGTINSKFGYEFGFALGGHVADQLRAEVELSHTVNNLDKFVADTGPSYGLTGNVSVTYVLGNLWYDIPMNSAFTPYVGGGIGAGWASINSAELGNTVSAAAGPAFQVGGGVVFDVADHIALDVGYRFKVLTGANFDLGSSNYAITDHALTSHNFNVGLTYRF